MDDGDLQRELERLTGEVLDDPGGPAFPALAEVYRKAGMAEEAQRVAERGLAHTPESLEGRVALALAHLDLGETETARRALAEVLSRPRELDPGLSQSMMEALGGAEATGVLEGGLDESELELAFAEAESDPSQMMDANRIAVQAMESEELETPEVDFHPQAHPTFATRTMADVLETQGDALAADAIRSSLETEPPLELDDSAEWPVAPEPLDAAEVPADPEPWVEAQGDLALESARRARILTTLDSWLQNIRREVA